MEATYSPVTNRAGRVLRVVKIAADVNERVQTLNYLESIQRALDASTPVIVFDADGTIRRANTAFLRLVRAQTDTDLIGKHHRTLCWPAWTNTPEYDRFWERLRQGTAFVDVVHRRRLDGEELWLQASYSPLLDVEGRVYGVFKIAQDVTERRQRALAFQALVEQAQTLAQKTANTAQEGARNASSLNTEVTDVRQLLLSNETQIQTLNRHMEGIRNVLKNIQDIAFQTNILAINAAIEAARAGESGRGFAVVADAVRQLAEKTRLATLEVERAVQNVGQSSAELASVSTTAAQRVHSYRQWPKLPATCSSNSNATPRNMPRWFNACTTTSRPRSKRRRHTRAIVISWCEARKHAHARLASAPPCFLQSSSGQTQRTALIGCAWLTMGTGEAIRQHCLA